MSKISYIIPHRGRDEILLWHLRELNRQSFKDFDVVVIVDDHYDSDNVSFPAFVQTHSYPLVVGYSGRRGPAKSRNRGTELAKSNILLFVGSDTIPHRDLVAQHYWNHVSTNKEIVQGYTPWHPEVKSEATLFIDSTGLQANWKSLQDKNEQWKRSVSAHFCLTTNYSISRRLFENLGGFDEEFPGAAWEDVAYGYELGRRGFSTLFEPGAINYHYHRYSYHSFVKRSAMEGQYRKIICQKYPEMSMNLLNPDALRAAQNENLIERITWAEELDDVNVYRQGEEPDNARKKKWDRWLQCCTIASLQSAWESIENDHPALKAMLHVHNPMNLLQVIAGTRALKEGFLGYANHCAEWLMTEVPDNWAAYAFAAEVAKESGDRERAVALYRKSLSINPSREWTKKGLKEILT